MREQTKKRMRDNYRKDNPMAKSTLRNGLLAEGKHKEVVLSTVEGLEPAYMDVYTLKDTAAALGRTVITIRRWINDKLIPPPIIECTVHGYLHYSEGELKLIASILAEHEKEFNYFHHTHTKTINRVWHTVKEYRQREGLVIEEQK